MRILWIALTAFLSILLQTHGQSAGDSSLSPSIFDFEIRGGITEMTTMLTLEFQLYPLDRFSVDAGLRPVPFSFYGGISYYPIDHLVVQAQSGYMELTDTPGLDAPVFQSDFFSAGRFGLLIGKPSGMQFTASIGAMFLVDHDYCSNCGFVDATTFVPRYQDEVKWLTSLEFGLKGWP